MAPAHVGPVHVEPARQRRESVVHQVRKALREDLARAREAWLESFGDDPQQRIEAEKSSFLQPFDDQGGTFDFHGLRVSFCTNLERAGVSLSQAQKLMRHSDPRLTASVYLHLELEDARRAVESLNIARTPAPVGLTVPKV